jgi:hypothetical protein
MADALRNAPPEAPGEARPPAPFVVGVGRSGTTLLQLMLDAHPELAMPHETGFVPDLIEVAERPGAAPEDLLGVITSHRRWGDYGLEESDLLRRFQSLAPITAGDAVRAFYRAYADRAAKPRWGDKTPGYTLHIRRIARAVPEAHFVHLIRDGRDVALSRVGSLALRPVPIAKAARRWRKRLTRARRQGARVENYLEVRYETLVSEPERTLRVICDFLELPWDDQMLRYHEHAEERLRELDRDLPGQGRMLTRPAHRRLALHTRTTEPPTTSRIGRWRTEMSPADRAAFNAEAGELLRALGYERADPASEN